MFNKITDNVEIHQTLPDTPNMTTQELKIMWDKGCKIIKEGFNNLIDKLNNEMSKIQEVTLYDRTGVSGENYGKTGGISGRESLNIDMSSCKRIKAFGYMNARKYQFSLEIDITDSLNDFDSNNKYWGRVVLYDYELSEEPYLYLAECSVNESKTVFTFENVGFRNLTDGLFSERNNHENYIITKIFGYKEN